MPLTRNTPRTYSAAEPGAQPLADNTVVYEGACMGVHAATGRVRALVNGDVFAGFARQKVDSTTLVGGQDAATVPLAASGVVELAVSGATATSLGASVYATGDDTFSLVGGSLVGTVVRVPSAGVVECKFAALLPALTAAQVGALTAGGYGQLTLSAAAASISLPSVVEGALWFPMAETTGTTATDRVAGLAATVAGTTTNLHDTDGQLTLNSDTALVLRNSSALDAIMRLDTLNGSLLVGLELEGGAPAATAQVWSYGDNGSNTVGGYSGVLLTSGFVTTWYGVIGGSINVAPPFNLQSGLISRNKRMHIWCINKISGAHGIHVHGFDGAWHSRSTRYRSLEAGPVGAATAQGLRIGARGTGAGGGSTGYLGAQITQPKLSNFFAIRLAGDQRHNIPAYIADIAATMPYGAVPRILAGG